MNKLIILNNKYCQFVTENIKEFNLLKRYLSYKSVGIEYTAAYQNGWNGINYLINKKGIFASGLLCKVKLFLQEKNIEFEETNLCKPVISNPEISLQDKLSKLSMLPRNHQLSIVDAALKNNKGIVRSCTGSGKTLCTALITAKLNKPTIIYVIGLDLLKQFHDLFSVLFDEPIGYIGNGVCKVERINIASIWTVGKALKIDKNKILMDDDIEDVNVNEDQSIKILQMLKTSNVHIFDESHVVTTNTISEIYKNIDPEYIYGFSGTPFRDDNTELLIHGILGEQIIDISASDLISSGLLAQPIIQFVPVPKMNNNGLPYSTVYKNYITENKDRNDLIIKYVLLLMNKGYTPLILFKQIKHGQILFKLMKENNIKCEMLDGNDNLNRREEVKSALIEKKIDAVLASTIYDLGVDIPVLSGLVLCGSGRSSIRALQRIGRVIRQYPGKKVAAVVDFYDQSKFLKKHSMIRYQVYISEPGFKVLKCKEMK